MQEPQDLQKLEQEQERQHKEAQEHKADQQGLRGEDWVEEGWERVTQHETHLRQVTAMCPRLREVHERRERAGAERGDWWAALDGQARDQP